MLERIREIFNTASLLHWGDLVKESLQTAEFSLRDFVGMIVLSIYYFYDISVTIMLIEIMTSRFQGCLKDCSEYSDISALFENDISGVYKFHYKVLGQIESSPNRMTSENQLEEFVDKIMEGYIQSPQ